MSEFNNLVQTICDPSTPQPCRAAAERQLLEILSNIDTWKQYSECLYTADDTVCFFVCIGFQKMVWRQWRRISAEDKALLSETVVRALTNRKSLQSFAKSKLEQVLATICVNSCSIEPVLGMLVDAGNPAVSVGLSTMRTVLELVLSDDPQLYPEYKPTLLSAVADILTPLTNLACSVCSTAIARATAADNSNSSASSSDAEQNGVDINTALDLLKVIISKLQIGTHITSEAVDLLFRVAELGAAGLSNHTSAASGNLSREALGRAAHSAIEILTEIMSKKYLPPAPPSASAGAPSSSTDSSSLRMLGEMLVKTTSLLQGMRSAGELGASPVALSLLEFVCVFAESHLERCIQLSSVSSSQNGGSSQGVDLDMDRAVALFLEELVATTSCTSSVEVLHKAVSVWNNILLLGAVKERLLGQGVLCLSVVSHLLQSCLLQTNEELRDCAEELLEDHLPVSVLSDPHMRAVLGHILVESSDGSDAAVAGAEEVGYAGTELLRDTVNLFADLVGNPEVAGWLAQTVEHLVGQSVARLHSGSVHPSSDALDLLFLVRVLPLVSNSAPQLTQQLVGLAVQLTTAGSHSRGMDFVVLGVTCCHQAGQLLQSGRVVPSSAAVLTTDTLAAMELLLCDPAAGLLAGLRQACSDSRTPTTVATAMAVLLLQTVSAYLDILEVEQQQCAAVKQATLELLQNIISQRFAELPVEIVALLICAQDLLQPQSIAPAIVAQCVELVGTIDSAAQHNYSNLSNATIEQLIRVTAALDALARNHSNSRPHRRQCLVAHFAPLQQGFMGKFSACMYRLLLSAYRGSCAQMCGSSVCYLAKLAVSLSCALLQSLGKKSFGKAAAEVLNVSVDFAETLSAEPQLSPLLFERTGLALTRQLLELTQVLAESTAATSPSVHEQAATTHRLLCFIAARLNDDRICAELLQSTLKAGITAVRCYWQKTHKSLPFLSSISQQTALATAAVGGNGDASTVPDINGENVRPIAVLLTQLCVGSLSPNVSPQDTLTALEGLIGLGEQHKLFSMTWFQHQCWGSLLTPCLKAVLLRIHNMHRPTLEQLLIALASAGEASYLAMAAAEAHASSAPTSQLGSPVQGSHALLDSPIVPGQARNVGDVMYAKYQEFWMSIGNEMIGIAAQYQCGESASLALYGVLNSYQAAAVAAGQYNAGITSISPHSSSRGPFLIDMRIFLDKIVQPVASEIARLN